VFGSRSFHEPRKATRFSIMQEPTDTPTRDVDDTPMSPACKSNTGPKVNLQSESQHRQVSLSLPAGALASFGATTITVKPSPLPTGVPRS